MAERVGFEPTRGGYPLPAFQASPFSRSGTSPRDACRVVGLSRAPWRGASLDGYEAGGEGGIRTHEAFAYCFSRAAP